VSRTKITFRATAWPMLLSGCLVAWGGADGVQSAAAEPSASPPALERFEYEEIQMGVGFKVVLYAGDQSAANRAARKALDRVAELNQRLSDYLDESELNKLCRAYDKDAGPGPAEGISVSDDLFHIIDHSQQLAAQSQGAFDITVGPLVRQWRRARRQEKLPSPDRLTDALAVTGYHNLLLDRQKHRVRLLKPGMQLDLGGIAKGYAADEALAVLKREGITRALVGAAGDIAASDPPPGEAGWRIGVAPLDAEAAPSRYLRLAGRACSTSGDAFQFVEIAGKRYSHLVDPKTGLGLVGRMSVTVVAPASITSDSVASAVCVLGPEQGMKLVESLGGVAALIVRVNDAGHLETIESDRWKKLSVELPQ